MEELKAGDILVFKAGDDWVGKTIAWLTDSDVSHAAMMLDHEKMVEMGSNGIYAGPVRALDGDRAALLRFQPEKDPAPLAEAAKRYLDSKTRYDFPVLALLSGLIIYRRIRPTPKLVAITDTVLRAACVALDRLIQSVILKNPDQAMVCSQLVYQVYEDCGEEYHIVIKGGLFQNADAIDMAGGTDMADGYICLADLADTVTGNDLAALADNSIRTEEELARELFYALTEPEPEMDGMMGADTIDLGNLPSWTNRFLEKLEEFLEKSESNIPLDALFITPADLAYKAANLTTVAQLDIKRIR